MAMVGVDSASLYRQTHSLKVTWLGLGSAATWHRSTFIKWTGWTLAMALPWWQHHKHCLGYYIIIIIIIDLYKHRWLKKQTLTTWPNKVLSLIFGFIIAHQHIDTQYWCSNSVCPSVRDIPYWMKTASHIVIVFSPYSSPISLVLPASNIFTKFRWGHRLWGR